MCKVFLQIGTGWKGFIMLRQGSNFLISSFLMFFIIFGHVAQARAEEYVKPDLLRLVQLLVRFGAVNLDDNEVIDDYSRIAECQIFNDFYKDDFKWRNIQDILRKKLRDNVATYPTSFYVDMILSLDRYDFNKKIYTFSPQTAPKNANSFIIDDKSTECAGWSVSVWPITYRFILQDSVTFPGLPLFEDDAKMLLTRMNESGNTAHQVFARYKMRVISVAPYFRTKEKVGEDSKLTGRLWSANWQKPIVARLDYLEFYEDPERTKLIYVYKP